MAVMFSTSRCGALILALFAAFGCGGRASSTGAAPAAGGSATDGSGGSMNEPASEPGGIEDGAPWFNGSGDVRFPMGEPDQILIIVALGTPARATVSTHNHTALLSGSDAVEFAARATAPMRLVVSASNAIQEYDYFAARDAGTQWPIAPVEVGLDWQDFSVPLSSMQPAEVGDPDGTPSFWLAFIVEHPEPVDVWLDEIRFRPRVP
jgi:hypothetical protein